MNNGQYTLESARAWLAETDALREEYKTLSVINDKVMRSADRRRFNTLSCILTIRNNQCEDVLRAVLALEESQPDRDTKAVGILNTAIDNFKREFRAHLDTIGENE